MPAPVAERLAKARADLEAKQAEAKECEARAEVARKETQALSSGPSPAERELQAQIDAHKKRGLLPGDETKLEADRDAAQAALAELRGRSAGLRRAREAADLESSLAALEAELAAAEADKGRVVAALVGVVGKDALMAKLSGL